MTKREAPPERIWLPATPESLQEWARNTGQGVEYVRADIATRVDQDVPTAADERERIRKAVEELLPRGMVLVSDVLDLIAEGEK